MMAKQDRLKPVQTVPVILFINSLFECKSILLPEQAVTSDSATFLLAGLEKSRRLKSAASSDQIDFDSNGFSSNDR
jgi:hypothetical protein